jgi:hypothetical protein
MFVLRVEVVIDLWGYSGLEPSGCQGKTVDLAKPTPAEYNLSVIYGGF